MKKKLNKKRDLVIIFISIIIVVVIMVWFSFKVKDGNVSGTEIINNEQAEEKIQKEKLDSENINQENMEDFHKKVENQENMEDFHKKVETADEENRYEFDKGNLKLEGSVEYEGPDFESGSMEFDTYTGLKIKNTSDKFLRKAEIELETSNGKIMNIMIDSIPAGKTVFTLVRDYKGFSPLDTYKVLNCESKYEETPICNIDGLNIKCSGTKIEIQNNTGKDYSGYEFYYKGKEENLLMSGITYSFIVDSLLPGSEYSIDRKDLIGTEVEIVEIRE